MWKRKKMKRKEKKDKKIEEQIKHYDSRIWQLVVSKINNSIKVTHIDFFLLSSHGNSKLATFKRFTESDKTERVPPLPQPIPFLQTDMKNPPQRISNFSTRYSKSETYFQFFRCWIHITKESILCKKRNQEIDQLFILYKMYFLLSFLTPIASSVFIILRSSLSMYAKLEAIGIAEGRNELS